MVHASREENEFEGKKIRDGGGAERTKHRRGVVRKKERIEARRKERACNLKPS